MVMFLLCDDVILRLNTTDFVDFAYINMYIDCTSVTLLLEQKKMISKNVSNV